MPVPRLFATGLWLGVTLGATAMVWMATSIVAADVTDRPAPVVAHREVVSELASGAPSAPATTTTTAKADGPPTTSPASRAPATTVPAIPAPQPTPPATTVSPAPTTTVKAPAAKPATTSTTQASAQTATYSTAGGVVGVSCSGFFITLVSAIPNNGFAANVLARGPANVDVHFVGSGQDLSVKAVCFGRPIRYYNDLPGSP